MVLFFCSIVFHMSMNGSIYLFYLSEKLNSIFLFMVGIESNGSNSFGNMFDGNMAFKMRNAIKRKEKMLFFSESSHWDYFDSIRIDNKPFMFMNIGIIDSSK